MAQVEVVAADLKTRMELVRLLQTLGHEPLPAASPDDLLRARRDRTGAVLVLAEPSSGSDWHSWIVSANSCRRPHPAAPKTSAKTPFGAGPP